jgi:hypothetical protein
LSEVRSGNISCRSLVNFLLLSMRSFCKWKKYKSIDLG